MKPQWSVAVDQAAWIADRLAEFGTTVSSVVPAGFEAYARVLHPAEAPHHGYGKLVRWHQVAAWSGMPLRSDAQFHSIALPMANPGSPPPWQGQGPDQGTLYVADAEVLASLLRQWTTTPEECWFCLWDGFGWENIRTLVPTGQTSDALPDPIPAWVRQGPRVCLPNRDYLLYSGPTGAVTASVSLADSGQTPNLWWPEDRAWCVATEIDLASTYVGGPGAMVEQLLTDDRIEAIAVDASQPTWRVDERVELLVEGAINDLMNDGESTITTSRGTVDATLVLPGRLGRGEFRYTTTGPDGGGGSGMTPLRSADAETVRSSIALQLTSAVISIISG